jgi:hypothetical protein
LIDLMKNNARVCVCVSKSSSGTKKKKKKKKEERRHGRRLKETSTTQTARAHTSTPSRADTARTHARMHGTAAKLGV